MTTAAPNMKALSIGNERRMKAAAWRRRVYALPMGEGIDAMVAELYDPDEAACTPLGRFLCTARNMGEYKAQRVLNDAHVNPQRLTRRLRDLTERERGALASALQGEVWKAL